MSELKLIIVIILVTPITDETRAIKYAIVVNATGRGVVSDYAVKPAMRYAKNIFCSRYAAVKVRPLVGCFRFSNRLHCCFTFAKSIPFRFMLY